MNYSDITEFFALLQHLDGKSASYMAFAVFFFILGKARLAWVVHILTTVVMSGFLIGFIWKGMKFGGQSGYALAGWFLKSMGFYWKEPVQKNDKLLV